MSVQVNHIGHDVDLLVRVSHNRTMQHPSEFFISKKAVMVENPSNQAYHSTKPRSNGLLCRIYLRWLDGFLGGIYLIGFFGAG